MSDIETTKRKPHRLDKYLDYLMPGKVRALTDGDLERLDLMGKIQHWRVNFMSPSQCIQKLERDHNLKKSAAYQLLDDSDYIFGSKGRLNKDAERRIQYELLHKAVQMISSDSKASGLEKGLAMERLIGRMIALSGTADNTVNIDYAKLKPQINILFTDEPRPQEVVESEAIIIEPDEESA